MKSKLRNFPGINIDHVLLALLILLVITMAARAHSQAPVETQAGLHLLDERADVAP